MEEFGKNLSSDQYLRLDNKELIEFYISFIFSLPSLDKEKLEISYLKLFRDDES